VETLPVPEGSGAGGGGGGLHVSELGALGSIR
jgi:hypothetical protein